MSELFSSPEFEEKVHLASGVSSPDPAFVAHLRQQIQHQAVEVSRRRSAFGIFMSALRKPAVIGISISFIIIVTVTLLMGPDQVLAAVRRLVGYIPGVGFVENMESTLILSKPVTITRNGVSVTVEEAVADGENTRILLRAEGLAGLHEFVQKKQPGSSGNLRLAQPDQSFVPLKGTSIEYTGPASVKAQMDFEPLASGVTQVTLTFSQVPGVPSGFAPENWEIQIQLQADSNEEKITSGSEPDVESLANNGIRLALTGIAEAEEKTALRLQLLSNDPSTFIEPNWWNKVLIHEASGRWVPIQGEPIIGPGSWDTVTLETNTLEPAQTYSLMLQGPIEIGKSFEPGNPDLEFILDFGPQPFTGQKWELNETFEAGEHDIFLAYARLIEGGEGKARLLFKVEHPKDVTGIMFFPVDDLPEGKAIGEEFIDFDEIPTGPVRFRLGNLQYWVDGVWEISFEITAK